MANTEIDKGQKLELIKLVLTYKSTHLFNPIPNGGEDFRFPPYWTDIPLLKQREAKQLETSQHFDKALICSCFDTIKKFLGVLEKKWGHAK